MITAFCILAEPEKLLYPYVESIRSVSHFCEKIIINFAANRDDNSQYRKFESTSYDNICKLQEEVSNHCQIIIKFDTTWKLQKNQTYDDWRDKFQSTLDEISSGWMLKFDADNVFRKEKSQEIRDLFEKDLELMVFRRANVIDKTRVSINTQSSDIYAINIDNLKKKRINYRIGDINEWCRVVIDGNHNRLIVEDKELIPFNYDATFFTRERVIDFWRRTEETYSCAQKRPDKFSDKTDEYVMKDFINYKINKLGSIILNLTHPEDIRERFENLGKECWGYSNFS